MNWRTGTLVSIVGTVIVFAVTVVFFSWPFGLGGSNGDANAAQVNESVESQIFGRVVNTQGDPVFGASVTVLGPFRSTEPAIRVSQETNETGQYQIGLPIDGEYNLLVEAEGFTPSILIGREDQEEGRVPEVNGSTEILDIVLQGEDDFVPARGPEGYVYGKGVEKNEVCEVLMTHRIIASCGEIDETESVSVSGNGWTTFIRSGQAVSTVAANYSEEPFWKVTFKDDRPDGLGVIYVQKVCGKVTVPPGKEMPKPTPTPRKEVISKTPTPTSPVVNTPPPSATDTPTSTKTPKKPTAMATPKNTPTNTPTDTPPKKTSTPPPQTPQPTFTPPVCECPTPSTPEPLPPTWEATATPVDINPTPTTRPPVDPGPTLRPPPDDPPVFD